VLREYGKLSGDDEFQFQVNSILPRKLNGSRLLLVLLEEKRINPPAPYRVVRLKSANGKE
jgi:hypothetical protein